MSKNNDIGSKCHQLYLMSLEKLKGDNPDLADEVIVTLWNTVDTLNREKKSLQAIIMEQQKNLSEYYHKQDILESRISQLTGNKSLGIIPL
jgi:hypothetical protein